MNIGEDQRMIKRVKSEKSYQIEERGECTIRKVKRRELSNRRTKEVKSKAKQQDQCKVKNSSGPKEYDARGFPKEGDYESTESTKELKSKTKR